MQESATHSGIAQLVGGEVEGKALGDPAEVEGDPLCVEANRPRLAIEVDVSRSPAGLFGRPPGMKAELPHQRRDGWIEEPRRGAGDLQRRG